MHLNIKSAITIVVPWPALTGVDSPVLFTDIRKLVHILFLRLKWVIIISGMNRLLAQIQELRLQGERKT